MTQIRGTLRSICLIAVLIPSGLAQAQAKPDAPPANKPPATQPANDVALNNATLNKLQRVLPGMHFNNVAFNDCIDFMRDVSGVKIVVQWDKLKPLGVTNQSPVTLDMDHAKMSEALTVLLASAAGKPGVLAYTLEHGDLIILPITQSTTQPK